MTICTSVGVIGSIRLYGVIGSMGYYCIYWDYSCSQLARSLATELISYAIIGNLCQQPRHLGVRIHLPQLANTLGDSDLGDSDLDDLGDSCWNASQIQGFQAFPPGIFIFLNPRQLDIYMSIDPLRYTQSDHSKNPYLLTHPMLNHC